MTHLTFGLTSSPFLATQVLRQVAAYHHNVCPRAAAVVLTTFCVDDCLTGTHTGGHCGSTQIVEHTPIQSQDDAKEMEDQLQ